jgi:hypothetical protein
MAEKLNANPTEEQCLDAILAELVHIDPYWSINTQQEDKNTDPVYNPVNKESVYSYRRLIVHLLEEKYIKKEGTCRRFKDQWFSQIKGNNIPACANDNEKCQKESAAAVILNVLYQHGPSMQNKKMYAILFGYNLLYNNNKQRLDKKFKSGASRSSVYYTSALSFLQYIGTNKPVSRQIEAYEKNNQSCLQLTSSNQKMACVLFHTKKILKEICPNPAGLASGSGIAVCRKQAKDTKSLKNIAQTQRRIFKGPLQGALNRETRVSAFSDHRMYMHVSAALLLAKGAYTFGTKLQGHCCVENNGYRTKEFCSQEDIKNCPAN